MTRADEQRLTRLEPGALWPAVRRCTAHAVARGALESIPTRSHRVTDGGIPFTVRVVESLERKARALRRQRTTGGDPFLPYDPDLFVADLSPTHLLLLNRFNVVPHHLLVITRAFEEQERPLGAPDLEPLWRLMAEIDGLAFYNSGPEAGASQRHRHLQLVPGPLGEGSWRAPVEVAFEAARFEGGIGRCPALPFRHALARLEGAPGPGEEASALLVATYRHLLAAEGMDEAPAPYNLLLTREWMMLVPRSRAAYGPIEVNALGFAGSLLVRNRAALEALRSAGPLAVLRSVGRPATTKR